MPSGLTNKMAMVAWMEVVSGLGNMTSTYQSQLGYGHCWVPNSPSSETNTEPPVGHHFPRGSASYWWQVGYTGSLPSQMGQLFVLTEIDTYSGYRLTSPPCNTSTKTTIRGFREYLTYCHSIPHNTASDQGIHWSYHVPYHPEAPDSIEQWNSPLKTQLQCRLGGNTL